MATSDTVRVMDGQDLIATPDLVVRRPSLAAYDALKGRKEERHE